METSQSAVTKPEPAKKEERNVLIFLVVFLAPILAVMSVGGYGFLIWMFQLVFGPPTG